MAMVQGEHLTKRWGGRDVLTDTSFEIHEGPDVPLRIVGDENRLRQVLVNLLGKDRKSVV